MRNYFILPKIMLITLFLSSKVMATDDQPVAWWKFDHALDKAQDTISKIEDTIQGNFKFVSGSSGSALKFDGYTTCIKRNATKAPKISDAFTIEAWIAIGAYPWNWCPIVSHESTVSLNSSQDRICWPEDVSDKSMIAGYYFGVGPRGELGLMMAVDGKWQVCKSKDYAISLKEWVHVVGVYHRGKGIIIYINGEEVGTLSFKEGFTAAEGMDLLIGMNHEKREPSHPVRAFATLPAWYSFDGIMDEIKIYDHVLVADEIVNVYAEQKPATAPDFPPRIMPSGPKGTGKFGAYYCNLKYYEEWDALWRVGEHSDIVVQFDNSPVRVVFWRGTRYSPYWVMENGLLMADQGTESFNRQEGCYEHMLDAKCHFSHVRIIENHNARVVVHWRNRPISSRQSPSQPDDVSGWSDWVDEYYTFYPDGIGVRKVILHTTGRPLGSEEVIALCHPGQRPEDVIELESMTLVNLKGQSHTYSWAQGSPILKQGGQYVDFGEDQGDKPLIMMINLKSKIKPFQIFEPECNMRIFAHEHREDVSHFPWWNHWPVAQVPSDGRYCQAADRASHFSLAWGGPPRHRGPDNTSWECWLYGATDRSAEELSTLAKSWVKPPELKIKTAGFKSEGYDLTERAYLLVREEARLDSALEFQVLASTDSPVVNLALVIKNWGRANAALKIDGQNIPSGKNFRIGHVNRLDSSDLVVWTTKESVKPISISLLPIDK